MPCRSTRGTKRWLSAVGSRGFPRQHRLSFRRCRTGRHEQSQSRKRFGKMGSRYRRCRPSYTVYINCGELSCQRSGRTCGQFAGCTGDDARRAEVERLPPAHYQCTSAATNRLPDCRGGLKVDCDKVLVPLAVPEQAVARRRRRILAGPSRQRSRFDLVRAAPYTVVDGPVAWLRAGKRPVGMSHAAAVVRGLIRVGSNHVGAFAAIHASTHLAD